MGSGSVSVTELAPERDWLLVPGARLPGPRTKCMHGSDIDSDMTNI